MADNDIEEAVARALEDAPQRNFRETVDLAVNLRDLDLNDPSQRVDEGVVLPSGTGQETQIVVFADGETAVRADDVADDVLDEDDLSDLADDTDAAKDLADETDFFVAEAPMMQDIAGALGQVLGPRGKMPTPLQPDDDVVDTVNRMKNTVQIRSRDRRTFHTRVGAEDMSAEDIASNIDVIMRRLHANLEKGPLNVDSVYVKTTMGPAVEVA
ncbi:MULTISPECIES: 50S ribosomal protein L1 [Halobacterium]|uniref:Large ribosomal subunit protein uL1 n=4 Tax=Halobacterium salinarum TaxID=2242 RepID=RL1_HALSA|nr:MULTISPECIES: 50S ribosomal protein L1 [Halobacterium]B0R4W2.1 RecName: Full=Large ribosomal subunit protein uL1; AltName: Full=50S ribosomal protein L1 [Halobacterium salinarum R1]P13575.2 RecName: Full=Large ribosomal subunit protein uL1; AltName: Full=50S ribosomal protein L1; AltName: Full=HL8 [Halobacterium salinarum NRC-1]AAG19500.1 50S ribosomal protein L1P [Halobacterium salinarum NRC-1]MCF2165008.1 50S ribosomal protein L1 [Halobacterium salinarum]MCF2168655.1 50S ribosomal protein